MLLLAAMTALTAANLGTYQAYTSLDTSINVEQPQQGRLPQPQSRARIHRRMPFMQRNRPSRLRLSDEATSQVYEL